MAARVTNREILTALQGVVAVVSDLNDRVTALEGKTVTAKPASGKARTRKPAKPVTPEWIVTAAQNKAARRELAAAMRANGVEPTGAAWTKAKRAAGIA
jgi:propanediol dehydratase small subunit